VAWDVGGSEAWTSAAKHERRQSGMGRWRQRIMDSGSVASMSAACTDVGSEACVKRTSKGPRVNVHQC